MRFSMKAVLGVALVAGVITGGIAAVLGDYSRAQLLRAKNSINLQIVSAERDKLDEENQDLKASLGTVSAEKDSSVKYKQTIEKRINELQKVLESAILMSGGNKKDSRSIVRAEEERKDKKKGVGGLEVECSEGAPCDVSETEITTEEELSTRARFEAEKAEQLISQMENLINLTKRLPLGVPIRGEITSGFGVRNSPFTGKKAAHKGIDFDLNTGDLVRCTGDGIVSAVSRNSTYGLHVDVRHNSNVVTRYAHLATVKVKAGQPIKRGQYVGAGGSTGRSTGSHLHYEIRINGNPKNPQAFLRLAERMKSAMRTGAEESPQKLK